MSTPAQPLTLWLTDRSRYVLGTGKCGRERYLTNHFGPTGYGLVRKAQSLPLATGIHQHRAFDRIFQYMQAEDAFPPLEVIRAAIGEACDEYLKLIEARGYVGLLQSERSDFIVAEQMALIAGLTLAACRTVLPEIHRNYKILASEIESVYVLDCTCGLGSEVIDGQAHSDRGCGGIGQMLRQDVIAQHRITGNLAYFETKTTGWGNDTWASQWETRPQLSLGSLGIEQRFGAPLTECYIVGLYKGSRRKDGEGQDATYIQDSPLCYGYKKAGNPPLATDHWVPAYEWFDPELRQTKRKSKEHRRSPTWLMAESDWPTWVHSHAALPDQTPAEFWNSWLPQSVIEKQVFLIGPLRVQDVQVASLKRQVVGEERKWQGILWALYEKATELGPDYWVTPEYHALLDHLVPASWDCRRYGARSECSFVDVCFKHEGWRDPIGDGRWVPRRPHHEPELQAAIARGLLPEQAEEDQGEEE